MFRQWTGIHAVGAAAKRQVWTQLGENRLYPNLYVFLVGPPGTGKSQSINPMTELLRKSQAVNIAPNDMTKQALLDVLYESARGAVIDGRPFDYHFLTICISELSNFMSKYDHDLTGLLTDLFDCPPSNDEKKRTSDNGKFIPFPGLSFIMGTATQNLGNTISNEMWGSGFMARVIMVYAAEEVMPLDMFASAKANPMLAEQIVVGLRRIGDLKGPMSWTPEARIALATFRRDQKLGAPVHNRLTFYVVRRWLHLGKLCMIAALSDQRMEVELEDYTLAHSWLLAAEADMPEIFKDMVSHEDGQIHEELRGYLFTLHMRSNRKPIEAAVLYNFLKSRVSSYSIPRIIEVAVAADYIRRVAGTSGDDALYVPQMPGADGPPKGAIWVRDLKETLGLYTCEAEVLLLLLSTHSILSREFIFNNIPHRFEGSRSHAIHIHIYRIRQKLGAGVIQSERGVGVRLSPEGRRMVEEALADEDQKEAGGADPRLELTP